MASTKVLVLVVGVVHRLTRVEVMGESDFHTNQQIKKGSELTVKYFNTPIPHSHFGDLCLSWRTMNYAAQ